MTKMIPIHSMVIALALAGSLFSAHYYVSKSGNDAGTGNASSPFRTIQKAANVVKPGDRVTIKAGVYYERVIIRTSGTNGNPIVFEGERGLDGKWKTIVDGSDATSGWVRASHISPLVYMTREVKYEPFCVISDDYDIPGLRTTNPSIPKFNPINILKRPPNDTVAIPYTSHPNPRANYWDGIDAVYHYAKGVTYVRFKNGENPTTKNVRTSPAGQAFLLGGKSYVTIRNFSIRGAQAGFRIMGIGAHHNVIEGNRIINGQLRLYLSDRASHNKIKNNEMDMNAYSKVDMGAFARGKTYLDLVRSNWYIRHKYEFGQGGPKDDVNIRVYRAGIGNEITENDITGALGVFAQHTRHLNIVGNYIHNAEIAIHLCEGMDSLQIFNNLLFDSNFNIRIQSLERIEPRSAFIYQNRFVNPRKTGQHIYYHYGTESGNSTSARIYLYHNSFSGADQALRANRFFNNHKGAPHGLIVNNIFSSRLVSDAQASLGTIDANWLGGSANLAHLRRSSFGSRNLLALNAIMWSSTQIPECNISSGSPTVDKGIDLSKTFVINGKPFPALPGMQRAYFSGKAPDLGAIEVAGVGIGQTSRTAAAQFALAAQTNAAGLPVFVLSLPAPANVHLRIYDSAGRIVSQMNKGLDLKGNHQMNWNGRNHHGSEAANGTYFCSLSTASQPIAVRRFVLSR